MRNSVSVILLATVFSVGATTALAQECDRNQPPFSYQFAPIDRLVQDSDRVVLATVADFVPDDVNDGLDGTYTLNVMQVYSGDSWSPVIVRGLAPFEFPPQYYFQSTELHESIDPQAVQAFQQIIVETRDGCLAVPKLTIGYTYLVLEDLNSFVSYEPIHSSIDAWSLAVRRASGFPY